MCTPVSITSARRRSRAAACTQFRREDWNTPAVLAARDGTLNTGNAELFRIGPSTLSLAYRQTSARYRSVRQVDQSTAVPNETGDTQVTLQSRLLRVLAEGEVTPVGASKPAKVNICELKQPLGMSISTSEDHHTTALDVEYGLRVIGTDSSCDAPTPPRGRPPRNVGARDENTKREESLSLLRRNRWNISRAAHEPNAARTIIYRRMSRLQIVLPHLRNL